MKRDFLSLAVCPRCLHPLKLDRRQGKKGEVITGALECSKCRARYEIRGGIPRFESGFDRKTSRNFGYSWRKFRDIYVNQKTDFLDWIHPVRPDFFRGKTVLDAGAGNGLHACFASDFGAKKVYAVDLSEAIDEAYENSQDYKNVHVAQANIYALPFKEKSFDYIYSIGVIQHLPEREKALKRLAGLVKKGGCLSIWVYGWEGTFFVRTFIEPLRRLLSPSDPRWVYVLSLPLAGLFFVCGKSYRILVRLPVVGRVLPMKSYFLYMARFPFRYQHNSVYDQLIAPRTHYFRQGELLLAFAKLGFKKTFITSRNRMSWRVFAQNKR
jgi:SAM-dependent methyltransferase